MSYLQALLDDVLAGRRIVRDPATYRLLRKFAPDRAADLDELERPAGHALEVTPHVQETVTTAKEEICLTRADLELILRHRRSTTIREVEWLLSNAKGLQLSPDEELDLRALAARLLADKHTGAGSRTRTDEFIARTIGTYKTPYGDLDQHDIARLEQIRLNASDAIQRCTDHKRERCECWKTAREPLFEIPRSASEKSPIGMAALAVWNSIEATARNRRVETQSPATEPPPASCITGARISVPSIWLAYSSKPEHHPQTQRRLFNVKRSYRSPSTCSSGRN